MIIMLLLAPHSSRGQDIEGALEQPPFSLSGSLGGSLSGRSADGVERFGSPVTWLLHMNATANLYGVQMPFSVILSEQDRSFQQPFNRFGISPSYKWVTTHFGYRSMSMSRYTLDGMTFFGAGLEATPGPVRVSAMVGRFQRAVEEDTTELHAFPAYHRSGYAFKLGFGGSSSYVDLSMLHASDDTNSLEREPVKNLINPQENTVFGLKARGQILPELALEFEGGASIHTRNLRSSDVDLESEIPGFLTTLQDVNSSSGLLFALRSGLNFALRTFGARLDFERIEPEFTSLGIYYIPNDKQTWTFAPWLTIPAERLRLSGSIGLQNDDLLGLKLARTNRVIGSFNAGWQATPKFGLDLRYSNYSTSQNQGLINDSIRVRNVSQSATLTPRYILTSEGKTHLATLVATHQRYEDLNAFTNLTRLTTATSASLLYNLSIPKTGMSGGASLLFSTSQSDGFGATTVGGSLNGSTTLFESRGTLGSSIGYSKSSNGTISSDVFTESLSISFRPGEQDNITLHLGGMQRLGTSDADASELTGTLAYNRSFSFTPFPADEISDEEMIDDVEESPEPPDTEETIE